MGMRRAPRPNPFFRPEEEHGASREYDVVPPPGRRHETVEEPVGRLGPLETHLEMKRVTGLLAARTNLTRPMQRRGDPKGIPGAVGEIPHAASDHDVLRRDTREWRRH